MITAATSRPRSSRSIASRSLNGTCGNSSGWSARNSFEAVVAGLDGEAGVPVVRLDDRDDLALLGGVPGGLQRDVDRFSTAGAVDHLAHPGAARTTTRASANAVLASEGKW